MPDLRRAALLAVLLLLVVTPRAAGAGESSAEGAASSPTPTADLSEGTGQPSPGPAAPPALPEAAEPLVPPGAATVVPPVRPSRVEVRPTRVEARRHGALDVGRASHPRWHGQPISASLRDAPLPEVLRTFARLAGVNLVLDPRVQGSVTVELVDVPWDQALAVILKSHGLAAELDGRVWLVSPR